MGNTFSSNNSRPPGREPERPQLEPAHARCFNPTRQDVNAAAHILMGLRLRTPPGSHLPPELALSILDHAGYRPRVTGSHVGRVDYVPRGSRPWYMTMPALPPDLGRAVSVTLQVRCEDHGVNLARLLGPPDSEADAAGYYLGHDGVMVRDQPRRQSTWFEVMILRPLHRAASPPGPPPVDGGYDPEDGCALQDVPDEPRLLRPRLRRPRRPDDFYGWDPECWVGEARRQVRHNGRDVWDIYHDNSQLVVSDDRSAGLSGERSDRPPTIEGVSPRGCQTYRVDWPPGNNPGFQDPEAFVDGDGFLAALRPGDMIVFSAAAQVSNLGSNTTAVLWCIEYGANSSMFG